MMAVFWYRASVRIWHQGVRLAAVIFWLWPLLLLPASVYGQMHEAALNFVERATVRISAGTSQSSGVLISPAGHVLTADHGVPMNVPAVKVELADGRQFSAEVLARDTEADAALLKISERQPASGQPEGAVSFSDSWLPLAGEAAAVEVGSFMVAAGFPARESAGSTVVFRLGSVLAADRVLVRTGCLLTAGDSGGPLVNRLGEVAGLHRQIGVGREMNVHVSADRLWRLIESAGVNLPQDVGSRQPLWPAEMSGVLAEEIQREAALSTVEILAAANATEVLMLGARTTQKSIVAKLSLLRPGESIFGRFANGVTRAMRIISQDVAADLVVLEPVVVDGLPPLGRLSAGEPRRGDVVFAVHGFASDGRSCRISGPGMISRVRHNEPRAVARLGLVLEAMPDGSGLRVRESAANGPATVAGLRMGDHLISLQGRQIEGLADVAAVLEPVQPGDWLELAMERGGERLRSVLQAGHDVATSFDRREFLDGRAGAVSVRRTGLSGVIQHDVAVDPARCGGLLLSHDGRILGWNVARRSREATLSWPWLKAGEETSVLKRQKESN